MTETVTCTGGREGYAEIDMATGSHVVRVTVDSGEVRAAHYCNRGDTFLRAWSGKTLAGARRWAAGRLTKAAK